MKKINFAAIIFIILFFSYLAYSIYLSNRMYVYQEIADDIAISSEWVVIKPKSTMGINRNLQKISLEIDDLTNDAGFNLILSDGTIINPEIVILDEYGNVYNLESRALTTNGQDSESGRTIVGEASFRNKSHSLPKDRTYIEVRIRSNKPFLARKIYWCNYNLK